MNRFTGAVFCFFIATLAIPFESALCKAHHWQRIRLGEGPASLHDVLLQLVLPLTLAAYLAGLGFAIAALRASSGSRRGLIAILGATALAGPPFLIWNFLDNGGPTVGGASFLPAIFCLIGVILALTFLVLAAIASRPKAS